MVKALARAFRWRKMLDESVHATLEDLARAKGVHATYVSRVLRLTLLAPEVVEAILDGRQPAELQLNDLLEGFPADQRSCGTSQMRERVRNRFSRPLSSENMPPRPGTTSMISFVRAHAAPCARPM